MPKVGSPVFNQEFRANPELEMELYLWSIHPNHTRNAAGSHQSHGRLFGPNPTPAFWLVCMPAKWSSLADTLQEQPNLPGKSFHLLLLGSNWKVSHGLSNNLITTQVDYNDLKRTNVCMKHYASDASA